MDFVTVEAPPGGWGPPWPLVREVAEAVPGQSWVVVGGLMTHVHARLVGVQPPRTTDDVDVLLDVVAGRASATTVAGALRQLGFTLVEPGWQDSPVHRFRRGDDIADMLSPITCPSTFEFAWRVGR